MHICKLILKRQNFSSIFCPPPLNYPNNGEFLPSRFFYLSNWTHAILVLYVTQTHDPYSCELWQLVSSSDEYWVWFQYLLGRVLLISYMIYTHDKLEQLMSSDDVEFDSYMCIGLLRNAQALFLVNLNKISISVSVDILGSWPYGWVLLFYRIPSILYLRNSRLCHG